MISADVLVLLVTWAATLRGAHARKSAGSDVTFAGLLLQDGESLSCSLPSKSSDQCPFEGTVYFL